MMVLFDSLQLNLTHSLETASREMLNEAHHLIPESYRNPTRIRFKLSGTED
jgi:hypothetical protein